MEKRIIYLIGSLRNRTGVMNVANRLQKISPDWEIFTSWLAPGPRADDYLRDYGKMKGLSYEETLKDYASTHIFEFDKFHIDRATDVIAIMKIGRSGHLELGYAVGKGKRGYILFDETPKRVDIMYQFATQIFFNFNDLVKELKSLPNKPAVDNIPTTVFLNGIAKMSCKTCSYWFGNGNSKCPICGRII